MPWYFKTWFFFLQKHKIKGRENKRHVLNEFLAIYKFASAKNLYESKQTCDY